MVDDDFSRIRLARVVDALCDGFEESWQSAGTPPKIEGYLAQVPVEQSGALLSELLGLDIEYRQERGERPEPNQYLDRWPQHEGRIRQVFERLSLQKTVAVDDSLRHGVNTAPGRLHLRCPQCRKVVDVAPETSLTGIACSSCGSHFDLVDTRRDRQQAPPNIGRFQIVGTLGSGAFGTVWKAYDPELDRSVAIKVPRNDRFSLDINERFVREARAAAQLRHPNIVSIHEIGQHEDSVYIVNDFVDGISLSDWLSQKKLTAREAVGLCIRLAEGVHHAHQAGVIHRDLKPANVMIDAEGRPYITDFGLAKREAAEARLTVEGRPLGTPAYMPPEQARGTAHQSDARADIYSLGAIFFELLTGEPPFRGDFGRVIQQVIHEEPPNPRRLAGAIPRDLANICLKCLEKQPGRRYHTAAELAADLRRWSNKEPIHARPVSHRERLKRWCARRPLAASLIGLVVVLTLAGFAGITWQWQNALAAQRERTLSQIDALVSATPEAVPAILANLEPYRAVITPHLRRRLAEEGSARRRLKLPLALLPGDHVQAARLGEALLTAEPREFLLIRDALYPHRADFTEDLWSELTSQTQLNGVRLRAACCLAAYDPDDSRWLEVSGQVVQILVNEGPFAMGTWTESLRSVKGKLVPALATISKSSVGAARAVATGVLVEYTADNPKQVVEVLKDADLDQFRLLFANLESHADRAIEVLAAELQQHTPEAASESNDLTIGRRQVNLVMALYRLGRHDHVWPLLKSGGDPKVRSQLIHRLATGSPTQLLKRLEQERDPSIRMALILSLGEFAEEAFDPAVFRLVERKLLNLFRDDRHPGIHGAAEWTLRRWNRQPSLEQNNTQLSGTSVPNGSRWFVGTNGHTMTIISGPVEVALDMDISVSASAVGTSPHTKRISRSFAIATKETTEAQFQRFLDDHPDVFSEELSSRISDRPQGFLNWYQAAAYCRWLSDQEGIPEDQMCYPPFPEIMEGTAMPADYLRRTGYRLPTNAEWEFACRAGDAARSYYGNVEGLRDKYAWHFWNSGGLAHAVGSLKPNDLGLFDMHGNVNEWCQECLQHTIAQRPGAVVEDVEDGNTDVPAALLRLLRGHSYQMPPGGSTIYPAFPVTSGSGVGFRVARTITTRSQSDFLVEGSPGHFVVHSITDNIEVSPKQASTPSVITVTGEDLQLRSFSFAIEHTDTKETAVVVGKLAPGKVNVRPVRTNTLGMKLAWIPAGESVMGTSDEEIDRLVENEPIDDFKWLRRSEGPRRRVKVERPFWMATREVTVGEFRKFVEDTGYVTETERDGTIVDGLIDGKWQPHQPGYNWRAPGNPQTDNHPVVLVTWKDAVAFCQWLSDAEGEEYRLPTEEEWEYACRAGSTQKWCFGDDERQLGRYAWVRSNSDLRPQQVGIKVPNAFGLHDMHGNVMEWCANPSNDGGPLGSDTHPDNAGRALRGASVWADPDGCRSAWRLVSAASGRGNHWGFRVVRMMKQDTAPKPGLTVRLRNTGSATEGR